MNIYDEGYIGLTSYNKFGYNVFGIHKSWYYLYDQPVGIKISEREHAQMQQLVFMPLVQLPHIRLGGVEEYALFKFG